MRKKKIIICLAVIFTCLLVVPVAYPSVPFAVSVQAASKIKISKKTVSIVEGKSTTIKLTGLTTKQKKTVKWSTSKKSVATVKNGKIIAKKAGKATITAKYKGKSYKCKVTVKKYNSVVKFEKSALSLNVGQTKTVWCTIGTHTDLWASGGNDSVAFEWGAVKGKKVALKVTGLAGGTAKIKAYDNNKKSIKDVLSVTVIQPVGAITISPTELDLELGEQEKITPSLSPADATNKKVTWECADTSVATVDANGNVTAKGRGKAEITATTHNKLSAICTVTVHDFTISSPSVPLDISYKSSRGNLVSSCQVNAVSFEKTRFYDNTYSVKMYLTGTKNYDVNPGTSSICRVGYKLYDADNIVVASGTFLSTSVDVGETFRDYCFVTGTGLPEGDYRLELLDVVG